MLKNIIALTAVATLVGAAHSAPVVLNESFDDVGLLQSRGWVMTNNSEPVGGTGWFQGNVDTFSAASGAANAYIGANYNNAAEDGFISNWLLTPALELGAGAAISFAFRGVLEQPYFDTLEVYVSRNGSSADVGNTASSTGDFELLKTLTTQDQTASTWATTLVSLAGTDSFTGRFAFRYVGSYWDANYIGLDDVVVTAQVPEPGSLVLVGLGICALTALRKRNSGAMPHGAA